MFYGARVEERLHQGVAVEIASNFRDPSFERLPDLTQGQDVFAQARGGFLPGHQKRRVMWALTGVPRPSTKRPSERSWGPTRSARLHRRAREGYGDRGPSSISRVSFALGQRQEGVVFGLAGPESGETRASAARAVLSTPLRRSSRFESGVEFQVTS